MSKCIVLVDVGNSQIKWLQAGDADVNTWQTQQSCPRSASALLASLVSAGISTQEVAVSSVADEDFNTTLTATLVDAGWQPPQFAVSQSQRLGLTNSYSEPRRMGVDRWLAMLAAWHRVAGPLIVVDAGTALTMDIVDGSGSHQGGYILPGIGLMESALMRDTHRVRFSDGADRSLRPGHSTAQCVTSGVWLAGYSAVQAVLSYYPGYRVLITGGDAQALMQLGLAGEWCPHLVLEGLFIDAQSSTKG